VKHGETAINQPLMEFLANPIVLQHLQLWMVQKQLVFGKNGMVLSLG